MSQSFVRYLWKFLGIRIVSLSLLPIYNYLDNKSCFTLPVLLIQCTYIVFPLRYYGSSIPKKSICELWVYLPTHHYQTITPSSTRTPLIWRQPVNMVVPRTLQTYRLCCEVRVGIPAGRSPAQRWCWYWDVNSIRSRGSGNCVLEWTGRRCIYILYIVFGEDWESFELKFVLNKLLRLGPPPSHIQPHPTARHCCWCKRIFLSLLIHRGYVFFFVVWCVQSELWKVTD